MSHILVVVIRAIIFVLVGLYSSPTLLLGFGLDLRSGDLSASNKQPQHFTLPLGSGVVRYLSLKIRFSTCSAILVGAGTPGCSGSSGPNRPDFRLSLTFDFEIMQKFLDIPIHLL